LSSAPGPPPLAWARKQQQAKGRLTGASERRATG
jgi:hypothetical protein